MIGVESFSIGMLLYYILQKKESWNEIFSFRDAWMLIIGGVAVIGIDILGGNVNFYICLFPLLAVIIGTVEIGKYNILYRGISLLGKLSLGIYLVHLLIFTELKFLFPSNKWLIVWNVVLSCVMAFLLEYLINRPFRRLLNRIWKQ